MSTLQQVSQSYYLLGLLSSISSPNCLQNCGWWSGTNVSYIMSINWTSFSTWWSFTHHTITYATLVTLLGPTDTHHLSLRFAVSRELWPLRGSHFPADPSPPKAPHWWSGTSHLVSWLDPIWDQVHLNWTPACEADFSIDGSRLDFLAWEAAQVIRHNGFFMTDWLSISVHSQPPHLAFLEILSCLPKWMVVMQVIVIYADCQIGT